MPARAPRPPPPRPSALRRSEGQRQRCVVAARRGIDRRGKLLLIEGGLLGSSGGVHQDEFASALNGARVPEVVAFADPRRRAGLVDHEALRFGSQRLAALVIGQRALCESGGDCDVR